MSNTNPPKNRWWGKHTSINIKIYIYIDTLKEVLNDIHGYFYNKDKEKQILAVYRLLFYISDIISDFIQHQKSLEWQYYLEVINHWHEKKTCVEKINNSFEDCIYLLLLKTHPRMLFRYLDGKETQHAFLPGLKR